MVQVQFLKENRTFIGEESPTAMLMLSIIGAARFERELILERYREGIALAKRAGVYKGRMGSVAIQIGRCRSEVYFVLKWEINSSEQVRLRQ